MLGSTVLDGKSQTMTVAVMMLLQQDIEYRCRCKKTRNVVGG